MQTPTTAKRSDSDGRSAVASWALAGASTGSLNIASIHGSMGMAKVEKTTSSVKAIPVRPREISS